jgi:tetratricopeptide (TPR) repeat protein
MGNYRQAIEVGRPAVEVGDEVVVSAIAKGTYTTIPCFLLTSQAEVGLFAEALADGEIMMRRAEAAGHPFAIELMCVHAGYAHARRGAAARAVSLLERGIKLCQSYALDIQVPWTASSLGMAYALAGRYEEGVEHAELAVKRGEALELTRYQPLRMTLLANVYLLAGRREDAHAAAHQALELARRYHEKGPEAWAFYLLAASEDVSGAAGMEEARLGYLAALRQSEELGMRPLSAHCRLGFGQLHATLGDARSAREYLEQALALYRDMSMQHWPEQAEEALRALS